MDYFYAVYGEQMKELFEKTVADYNLKLWNKCL